ncbi:hypothetical protein TERTU_4290 [Teredinibacter turnerae T7901]|uniref:Uncharacterized protein n=1 Tax=Teredinibacter turnerae (strain ATCC 39867 / T7901) TaxID=377629 RepID=C5BIA9_TERTT|nr:hypothetical protein TERTU_4290 [Teredinibacter turnerae T7901]
MQKSRAKARFFFAPGLLFLCEIHFRNSVCLRGLAARDWITNLF